MILRTLLIILIYHTADTVLAGTANSPEFLGKGQEYLKQGRFHQALDSLELALNLASTQEQKTLATGALGLTHYQLHHEAKAEELLRQAIALKTENRHEQARWHAILGTMMFNQRKSDEAGHYFTSALKFAEKDPELTAGIELQQTELLPLPERLSKLTEIQKRLLFIKPSAARSNYMVRLAVLAHQLGHEGTQIAYNSLVDAQPAAPPRVLAEIFGELAQLYEDDQRYAEAVPLNQKALAFLTTEEAPDLLLELEWRQGRLLRQRHLIPDAIAAYQRAVEQIESIRHDIPLTYSNGESSFRTTLEPLYQQLADILLEQAKGQNETVKALTLRHARNVIELVKQSELEEFLGGRCAIQPVRSALLEAIEPKTAVLYPVILADRLELLVSSGNEIRQFSQPITGKNLHTAVNQFVGALRSDHPEIKTLSTPLYKWLIAPIENFLAAHHIQTIVVVPDSFLRLVPFAAIYDGKGYLIERYAISTSPGLSIIEPSPIQPHQLKSLIVGLSEPGNVIDHLPETMISNMGVTANRGIITSQHRSRALSLVETNEKTTANLSQGQQPLNTHDARSRQIIKEALSLPGVVTEISSLQPTLPGAVLLNENFTVERFRQELLHEPYAIVHIASHLIVGSSTATSFIMANDDIINFDQLDSLLRSEKFVNQPLEMLTLSACQTAEGDDRAPLGLSGLAIKAKVRSALGTLWPVNDEAAPLLMVEFYKALNQPGFSKAKALQQAQKALLQNKKLEHPFFWAPYLLVGNWL